MRTGAPLRRCAPKSANAENPDRPEVPAPAPYLRVTALRSPSSRRSRTGPSCSRLLWLRAACLGVLAASIACVANVESGPALPGSGGTAAPSGAPGGQGVPSGSGGSVAGNGGAGIGGTGGVVPGPDPKATEIPARIRRLANAEYDRTVAVLLGTNMRPAVGFAPDARQGGFTVNADQRVDGLYADQLKVSAETLAHQAVTERLSNLVPCASSSANEACATTFIETFGRRAFRRPLTADEKSGLLEVFRAGSDGATFAEGIELVITAVLQAPAFLYLTEIGSADATASGKLVTLTHHEVAAQLAYLLTGGPPDDTLGSAANAGGLGGAKERAEAARRLLTEANARGQTRRLLNEWLGIDTLTSTDKDAAIYPRFRDLRPAMLEETGSFVDEVLWRADGSLRLLLTADFTVAQPAVASLYGLGGGGSDRLSLESVRRRGILHHASFLSVHAHADGSAPVIRGAVIRRKLFCQNLVVPTDPNVVIVFPPPDPTRTTRQRYEAHVNNAVCASCHALIDPMGFAFEKFDGIGAPRTMENGKPIDTTGKLAGTDVDGDLGDSMDLVMRLGSSAQVRNCFARNVLRFGSAQTSEGVERAFLDIVAALPVGEQDKLVELLVAFAQSDLFVTRRVP